MADTARHRRCARRPCHRTNNLGQIGTVGFTTLLTGLIAHHVVNDPAPILAVLPTESDCRDYMASDIEPIFAASPSLRGVLGEPGRSEAGRNLITHRMFEGGSLKVVAAKAPRNLRRHTARIQSNIDQNINEAQPYAYVMEPCRTAEEWEAGG